MAITQAAKFAFKAVREVSPKIYSQVAEKVAPKIKQVPSLAQRGLRFLATDFETVSTKASTHIWGKPAITENVAKGIKASEAIPANGLHGIKNVIKEAYESAAPKLENITWQGFKNGAKSDWDKIVSGVKTAFRGKDEGRHILSATKAAGAELYNFSIKRMPIIGALTSAGFSLPGIYSAFADGEYVEGSKEILKSVVRIPVETLGFAAGAGLMPLKGLAILGGLAGSISASSALDYLMGKSYLMKKAEVNELANAKLEEIMPMYFANNNPYMQPTAAVMGPQYAPQNAQNIPQMQQNIQQTPQMNNITPNNFNIPTTQSNKSNDIWDYDLRTEGKFNAKA